MMRQKSDMTRDRYEDKPVKTGKGRDQTCKESSGLKIVHVYANNALFRLCIF